MLVSSIARFNALKTNAQMQNSSANSFNGVQQGNQPKSNPFPFSINDLKSAINKLNVLA